MRDSIQFEDDVIIGGAADRRGTLQLDHALRSPAFLNIEAPEHRRSPGTL
jgi:hypothetical protein